MVERPDLDAIEKRAAEATGGPWYQQGTIDITEYGVSVPRFDVFKEHGRYAHPAKCERLGDAAFIAASRTDVPTLVVYARHLEAEVERAAALVAEAIHSEEETERYCAASVGRALDRAEKAEAELRALARERLANPPTPALPSEE